MEALDRNGYDEAVERLDDEHQVITEAPPPFQKLHGFTVICLVLNRTIGSGIFVTPTKVLLGTGSVGTSLLFWAAGAMVTICGLLVWLELGLTLPLRIPFGENEKKSVPRSGGEFNYVCRIPKPTSTARRANRSSDPIDVSTPLVPVHLHIWDCLYSSGQSLW